MQVAEGVAEVSNGVQKGEQLLACRMGVVKQDGMQKEEGC